MKIEEQQIISNNTDDNVVEVYLEDENLDLDMFLTCDMQMKKKRSKLWNFFEAYDEKSRIAKCNICKVQLSYKTCTSNLRKHMRSKHPTVIIEPKEDSYVSFIFEIFVEI